MMEGKDYSTTDLLIALKEQQENVKFYLGLKQDDMDKAEGMLSPNHRRVPEHVQKRVVENKGASWKSLPAYNRLDQRLPER